VSKYEGEGSGLDPRGARLSTLVGGLVTMVGELKDNQQGRIFICCLVL